MPKRAIIAWALSHKVNLIRAIVLVFGISLLLFILGLIILGGQYNNDTRIQNIVIFCVNLDFGPVGSALTQACQAFTGQNSQQQPTLQSQYFGSYDSAKAAVVAGEAWGAIVANPNASNNLLNAISAGSNGIPYIYNPTAAVTIILDPGRNPLTTAQILHPTAFLFMGEFSVQFATEFWENQLSQSNCLPGLVPLIVQPVSYTIENISVTNIVGVASTQPLIFLIAFSLTTIVISLQFLSPVLASIPHIYQKSILVIFGILFSTWIITLGLSGATAVLSGVAGYHFIFFWFVNWLQQAVYMTFFANLFILLGLTLLFPIFIFFLVFNVAVSTANLDITDPFYRYGYAAPVYEAVQAQNFVLFGGYDVVGRAVGVLVAWLAPGLALIPFTLLLNRYILVPRGLGNAGIEMTPPAVLPAGGPAAPPIAPPVAPPAALPATPIPPAAPLPAPTAPPVPPVPPPAPG